MFFKEPVTKKTIKNKKNELKHKLIFWNRVYGTIEAPITHKLDYIPENWMVSDFSSLQPATVYDTQGFSEILYNNLSCLNLKLHHIMLDYRELPPLMRNTDIVKREYARVQTFKSSNLRRSRQVKPIMFTIANIPLYKIFIATNTIFVRRMHLWLRKYSYRARPNYVYYHGKMRCTTI